MILRSARLRNRRDPMGADASSETVDDAHGTASAHKVRDRTLRRDRPLAPAPGVVRRARRGSSLAAAGGVTAAMSRLLQAILRHRKQGPIQFLENNPIQSSFWVRFHVPQDKEKIGFAFQL